MARWCHGRAGQGMVQEVHSLAAMEGPPQPPGSLCCAAGAANMWARIKMWGWALVDHSFLPSASLLTHGLALQGV